MCTLCLSLSPGLSPESSPCELKIISDTSPLSTDCKREIHRNQACATAAVTDPHCPRIIFLRTTLPNKGTQKVHHLSSLSYRRRRRPAFLLSTSSRTAISWTPRPLLSRSRNVLAERAVGGLARFIRHGSGTAAAWQDKHLGPPRGERPAGRAQGRGLQSEPKGTGLPSLGLGFGLRAGVEKQLLPLCLVDMQRAYAWRTCDRSNVPLGLPGYV